MNFCRRCGEKLVHNGGNVYKCKNEHTSFLNSAPAVGVFILTPENDVILGVRTFEPFKGKLDSVGGFVDNEENFEQALQREIKEEIGLSPEDYEPFVYLSSGYGVYPYGGEDCPVLSTFYSTRLVTDKPLVPNDDVAEIVTIAINDVDIESLGGADIVAGFKALKALYEKGEL